MLFVFLQLMSMREISEYSDILECLLLLPLYAKKERRLHFYENIATDLDNLFGPQGLSSIVNLIALFIISWEKFLTYFTVLFRFQVLPPYLVTSVLIWWPFPNPSLLFPDDSNPNNLGNLILIILMETILRVKGCAIHNCARIVLNHSLHVRSLSQ